MTVDSRAAEAAESLRQSVADIQPGSPPTGKSRVPLVLLAVSVVAAGLVGLSQLGGNDEHRASVRTAPATTAASVTTSTTVHGPSAAGSCRSELARKVVAGGAVAEWVPLSFALARSRDADGPVFSFTGINDLGPDKPPASEGPNEPDRVVTFVGVKSLRGTLPNDLPLLVSPYQLADAQTEAWPGVELLGRVDPQGHNGRRFVGFMIAVGSDGSASFLGDCIPKWTPALASYSARVGTLPAVVARALLLDSAGPVATAFLSSPEAQTLAGP